MDRSGILWHSVVHNFLSPSWLVLKFPKTHADRCMYYPGCSRWSTLVIGAQDGNDDIIIDAKVEHNDC